VAAWVGEVPAYGIVSCAIDTESTRRRRSKTPRVTVRRRSIENDACAVTIHADGTVSLLDRASGRTIESLLDFVDEADAGDLYTPAPRPRKATIEFRGAHMVHRGPLRGELALRYRVVDTSGERARIDVELTVHLILDAGSPFVRISIIGDNRRQDHRLRVIVRTDVVPTDVRADATFGPVRRERELIGERAAASEAAPPTDPLHRYVSVYDDSNGCTLFSDGLAEYEAREDGSLLVTLVRSIGELSRNDIPERPGHAGWPAPTPGAQCLGAFAAELAVMFHGARNASTIDAIERAADDVLCPLVGTTLRSALAVPAPVYGIELVGAGLAFSTVKESEDGAWIVLRCVNLLDEQASGSWGLPFDLSTARLARLDETPISDLATFDRRIDFNADPHGIVTILVR